MMPMRATLALALCIAALSGVHATLHAQDEMTVEGTLGSLPTGVVRRTIQAKHPQMTACFTARYATLPVLGGRIGFTLRVANDGSVRAVRLTTSTVGDRDTERCIVALARSLRFPPPTGGEAEVRETFELAPQSGMRPPTAWTEARVRPTVARSLEGLRRRCNVGAARVSLTVIIGPSGRAVMVGVSSDDEVRDAAFDCLAQAAAGFSYPDPGSYYAKATLTL